MNPARLKIAIAVVALLSAVLLLQACADLTPGKYAKVIDDQQKAKLEMWRNTMWVIIVLQVVIMLPVRIKQGANSGEWGAVANLIFMLLSIPLCWTKLGEWGYRLTAWVLGWGFVGQFLTVLFALLSGLGLGVGSLIGLILGGHLFHDIRILQYLVLPTLIGSIPVNLYVVARRGDV